MAKITTIYKLTDQNMQTHGGFQWSRGEWRETGGEGDLCGPGWLHCYSDPLLAVLLNPIHADIKRPRLFRGEGAGEMQDDRGLKRGYTRMRITEEIELPVITPEQRVQFAILCARAVIGDALPKWSEWADSWMNGANMTEEAAAARAAAWAARAARAAAEAAEAARAARAAAWAAAAAEAARAAARAARAAAEAAEAARAARAAEAAAWAAAAAEAARAAEAAAWAAAIKPIDLAAIAREAISQ